jgi:predicted dehydrogenase
LREKYGVKFYETIEEMCANVDAVLLESVDGRPHLEQVKPVIKARKPVYVDKPMAGSLKDVLVIFKLAGEAGVPIFSSSSLQVRDATCLHNGSIGSHLPETTSREQTASS